MESIAAIARCASAGVPPAPPPPRNKQALAAFAEVLTTYAEARTDSGVQASDYTEVDKRQGGRATYTRCNLIVRPTKSDFVCDVEVNARRVLTRDEFGYFKRYYVAQTLLIADPNDRGDRVDGRDKYLMEHLRRFRPDQRARIAGFDRAIREKLGACFRDEWIFPTADYFRPSDLRDNESTNLIIPLNEARKRHEERMATVTEIKAVNPVCCRAWVGDTSSL